MNPVLAGKFITVNNHITKAEQTQINSLTMHLKVLEKQKQSKSNASIGHHKMMK